MIFTSFDDVYSLFLSTTFNIITPFQRPSTRVNQTTTILLKPFLVGAFSLKEKSPIITVGSFFSADNLTLNGLLFLQFLQSYNFSISQFLTILSLRSSIFISFKKLNGAKEYFRLCETFFRKFFFHRRVPPSIF